MPPAGRLQALTPTPFIGALEREVGMTGSCPSILPRAHGKLGRRASRRPRPPGCRQSRGTRARGIVLTLRALRVYLFPEEVLTANTRACDGHACTCARRLRCSPEALRIICAGGGTLPSGRGVRRRAGLTPVSRRQARACTRSCTQMLGAGPARWEDFPGVGALCCSRVRTSTGDTNTGGNLPSRHRAKGFACWPP